MSAGELKMNKFESTVWHIFVYVVHPCIVVCVVQNLYNSPSSKIFFFFVNYKLIFLTINTHGVKDSRE